jgi:hypothetical protein
VAAATAAAPNIIAIGRPWDMKSKGMIKKPARSGEGDSPESDSRRPIFLRPIDLNYEHCLWINNNL